MIIRVKDFETSIWTYRLLSHDDYVRSQAKGIIPVLGGWYKDYPIAIGMFTGLHDKGGKYIYVGDIVRVNNEPFPWVVKWDDDAAKTIVENPLTKKRRSLRQVYRNSTIIGNTTDNPELLKGGKHE